MADDNSFGFFGRSLARVEDDRLLRGQGCFIDDLDIPNVVDIAFGTCPLGGGADTAGGGVNVWMVSRR